MAHITMAVPPPPPPPGLEGSSWTERLNLSSLSLLLFSELKKALDTNKYNWWRVLIFLPLELQTRSDWSLTGNNLLAIQHFHTYSFARITSKRARLLWGLKLQFSVPIWSPWELNLTHRRQLSLTEGESDFLPLPVFFLRVSSAIAYIAWVFAIRASCFHIFRKNLGETSQAC